MPTNHKHGQLQLYSRLETCAWWLVVPMLAELGQWFPGNITLSINYEFLPFENDVLLPTLFDSLWCQRIKSLTIWYNIISLGSYSWTIDPQHHSPGRSILGLLTSATSRTAMAMSSQPGSTMSSPLARLSLNAFSLNAFPIFHNCICSMKKLQGNKPFISLPKGKGVKLTIAEERDKRLGM